MDMLRDPELRVAWSVTALEPIIQEEQQAAAKRSVGTASATAAGLAPAPRATAPPRVRARIQEAFIPRINPSDRAAQSGTVHLPLACFFSLASRGVLQ